MDYLKNTEYLKEFSLTNMKETTAAYLMTFITFMSVLIALIYYIYYSTLEKTECSNMESLYGTLNGKIRSMDNSSAFDYNLRDYYIKSAYNCCSGGNYRNDYVDLCVLKNLLKQGVRGLDFEIYSIDDNPVVATSTTDNYFVKETFNYVNFSDVMNVINNYAFATSTAPNAADPIILHLRIKSTNNEMFKNFALLLESYDPILLSKDYDSEYYGHNFGKVPVKDLMGKVSIIVDKSNTAFMECPEFYKFVNMTSNSVFMRALHYYDIKYTQDMAELIEFNKQNMTIGMPDKGANPENPSSVVMREMGCQMLAMRYQTIDVNVEENDIFFDESGYAFVLKPINLRYIPVTIPAPPPQDPKLSYATREVKSDFYSFNI
jgi:Phosphatidylinositol-specific phospholipase C, X domain